MKYRIIPLSANVRREKNSYEHGCDPDSAEDKDLGTPEAADSVLEVMSKIVGHKLKPDDVYTFDPNIYCDTKSPPGYRVVTDNTEAGRFRVEHDRLENRSRQKPTAAEMGRFESGEITLWQATYELRFGIRVVGCGTDELAELLGIHNGEHVFVAAK